MAKNTYGSKAMDNKTKKRHEFDQMIAEIIGNGVRYSPQVGGTVIFGAIEALWSLHEKTKKESILHLMQWLQTKGKGDIIPQEMIQDYFQEGQYMDFFNPVTTDPIKHEYNFTFKIIPKEQSND